MKKKNPYQVLDVDRHADAKTIKRAYRNKAKRLHPDKGGDKSQFQEINSAYAVLSDPIRRRRFDETGDEEQPRASDGVQLFMNSIIEAAQQNVNCDALQFAVRNLKAKRESVRAQQNAIVERAQSMRLQGAKYVKKSTGDNLIAQAFQSQAESCEKGLIECRRLAAVIDSALEIASQYESRIESQNSTNQWDFYSMLNKMSGSSDTTW